MLILVFLVLGATLGYVVCRVKNAQNQNNNLNLSEIEMNGTSVEQGRGAGGYQIISDHSMH
jgi:hypothetical protein